MSQSGIIQSYGLLHKHTTTFSISSEVGGEKSSTSYDHTIIAMFTLLAMFIMLQITSATVNNSQNLTQPQLPDRVLKECELYFKFVIVWHH